MSPKLKILIVDDHTIVRQGLISLINKEPDMEVTAEAAEGVQAVKSAEECHFDVIVMDITMPDLNGIDATRMIRRNRPDAKILALSMEADRRFVVEVLKAGALGYLLKDAAFAELATAIRIVAGGETYLAPRVTEVIVRDYLQRVPSDGANSLDTLTPREREILKMIANGLNIKEIALASNVSVKTVENQRNCIMNKLDLYNIASLTKFAIREGLSSL